MKWLENLTWQKLILIAFIAFIVLLIFNPPVAERLWQMVSGMTQSSMNSLNLGG